MTAVLFDPGLRRITREEWDRAFTPTERLTVSEHADRYRYLSPEYAAAAAGGPVRWSTDFVPYGREIMDCLSDPDVREVTLAKSAQTAGSSFGENWLTWIAHHRPGPTLIVWPTEKKFRANVLTRLDPMIRDTPVLAAMFPRTGRRTSDDSISIKRFPAGYWQNLTAKSTADLRSFSALYIYCEELDEWEVDVNEQGDPFGMIEARVIAFGDTYKIFAVSTPSLEGHSRIWPRLEASSNARYHVPCPNCNGGLVFEWQASPGVGPEGEPLPPVNCFAWERDEAGAPIAESVRYRCRHCTRLIGQEWRDRMVTAGDWIHQFPHRKTHRGFHIWSAYFARVNWATIVAKAYDSRNEPKLRKTFVNLWLGLCYKAENQKNQLEADHLRRRVSAFPVTSDGEVAAPMGVGLLTAFCDVQVDRLEVFVEGWGAEQRNWKYIWQTLEGDPSQPEVWGQLAALLQQRWPHESGHQLRIVSMAVDANYQKRKVHEFTTAHAQLGAFPTIGKGGRDRKLLAEPGKPKSKKALSQWKPVWLIGVDAAKDAVAGMLRASTPGPGSVEFSDKLDAAYFDQLTAEALVVEYVKGRPTEVWRPKPGRRNEALDGAVGNLIALEKLGAAAIRRLGELAEELRTTPVGKIQPPPAAPPGRRVRSPGLGRSW